MTVAGKDSTPSHDEFVNVCIVDKRLRGAVQVETGSSNAILLMVIKNGRNAEQFGIDANAADASFTAHSRFVNRHCFHRKFTP